MSREKSQKLQDKYFNYLTRLKETFANRLKECTTVEEFETALHNIFEVKWEGYIKYPEMINYYFDYLIFLESIQALHNDYINNQEKRRLVGDEPDIPILQLTKYETNYMRNGKLVALMNPHLLVFLKEFIEKDRIKPEKAVGMCKNFYGDLLPEMTTKDYSNLLKYWWSPAKEVRKAGKKNKIKIIFSNGEEQILTFSEAMTKVVLFYGPEQIKKSKVAIGDHDLVMSWIPMGKEQLYDNIGNGYYLYNTGNSRNRLNTMRMINMRFGNKLKIEMV